MKPAAAILLSMMSLVAAMPAVAQRTGTRIGANLETKNVTKAIGLMADCYAGGRNRQATKWLRSWPGSEEETSIVKAELAQLERCMVDRPIVMDNRYIKMDRRSWRRPLGAEMARQALLTIEDPVAPAPNAPFRFGGKPPAGTTVDAAQLAYLDFGHCVALAAWNPSVALIRSAPGSPAEKQAIDQLIPVLGPCLVEGSKVELKRDGLREIVGEPVFHLLTDTQVAQ